MTPFPDLLFATPSLRVDPQLLGRALVFGFSAGDTDRAFEKSIETARCPVSPFTEASFARDLFVEQLVEQCLKVKVNGKSYPACKPYLYRILCSPSVNPEDTSIRQRVFGRLIDNKETRRGVERLYVMLVNLRETLSSGDFSSRVDQNQRRLEILRALATIYRELDSGIDNASVLGRLAEYGNSVVKSDGYHFLSALLEYEEQHASVDVRLQLGSDGAVREFEVLTTSDNRRSPLHSSLLVRIWRRIALWAKGYRVTENEVLSRLIFRAFEGIKDAIPPLFQLIGDLEFYLSGLGLRDLCTNAGLPTCFATFSQDSVESSGQTRLQGLFNPFLVAEGVAVRRCDIQAPAHAVVILTGPNSGGKTRLMQSVALSQLLGQGGMPVPASSAELPRTQGLFVSMLQDVRADQPEGRLGMELMRIRTLFEQLRPGDIVVLDELCSGTNPSEGEEIFQLVIELIALLKPQVWISTHFLKLAHQLEQDTEGGAHPYLRFLQVVLDSQDHPTFQFKPGVANTSLARQTAARLGVTRAELLHLVHKSQQQTAECGQAQAG